jgi:hypothetical protein
MDEKSASASSSIVPSACRAALTAFAAFFADLSHVLAILSDFGPPAPSDLGHVLPILGDFGSPAPSDIGHVLAVLGDFAASFASSRGMSLRIAMPAAPTDMLAGLHVGRSLRLVGCCFPCHSV